MSLPEISIRRPITTLMVYIGVFLFGAISFSLLSRDLFPPISYPQLSIVTSYENAAPEEIETLITKPIEEAVGGISGLRKVTSTSKEGLSLVAVEFGWNQNMDFASLQVREKIDLIKERLPRDAAEPVVKKNNPFELPVMLISISSTERTPIQLREVARKWFKDELEKIHGVASATISGGAEEQILIDVDQAKLRASRISITEVSEAVGAANLNYPGGTIKESFYEYLVRTLGEFKHIEEVGQIPIKRENLKASKDPRFEDLNSKDPSNRLILLKDVAEIKRTMKERTSFSRFNSVENVTIAVQKQAQGNTVQVTDGIRKRLSELREQLPKDIRVDVISDQSKSIKGALGGVGDSAWQGMILAYLVLVVFLKDFKNSSLVITITPVTVLATFTLMYFWNISLNVISLGGLALGVGMLLDNAVVVMENVYRMHEENPSKSMDEAAIQGSNEVMAPMAASTLTTVCVFLPIMFVTGIAGQIFKELALVVVVTQVISAVIAFTLLSMMIVHFPRLVASLSSALGFEKKKGTGPGVVSRLLDMAYLPIRGIEIGYGKFLPEFIRRKWFYLFIVFLIFVGSIFMMMSFDKVLLPKIDQGEFTMKVDLPVGARVQFTNEISKKIEAFVSKLPEVKTVSSIVGSSRDESSRDVVERLGAHQAQITVTLKSDLKSPTNEIVQKVREHFELSSSREQIYPARLSYVLNDSAFGVSGESDAPIVIEIKGRGLPELKSLALQTQEKISSITGIYGISNSLAEPFPETKLIINKDRASYYKLSVVSIAQAANIAMKGTVPTKFKEEGREIDIRVQLKESDRDQLGKLSLLMVHSPLDLDVPLGDFVKFVRGKGPSEIKRISQERTVQVYAKIYKRELQKVVQEVQGKLDQLKTPAGYEVKIAGESEEIQESFTSLRNAFILSIALVYMVMAAQFESLWQPFIIMFCLPLSVIGVAASLWIFQTPISIVAILGIILLGGIVVNNGIILIDYINQLRAGGMPLEEATITAGKTRLKPILMTAFSSAFGAFPLALSKGEDAIQAPLGVTAIGGILIATFLTLVVIPAIYIGAEQIAEKFRK